VATPDEVRGAFQRVANNCSRGDFENAADELEALETLFKKDGVKGVEYALSSDEKKAITHLADLCRKRAEPDEPKLEAI
jgi:hypothetical protein